MTLTDDDRLWRDQNFPNLSDEDLEKFVKVFGSNVRIDKENGSKIKTALDIINKYVHKLFIDEYKTPYAAIPIDGHLEIFPINGKNFKNWCRMMIFEDNEKTIDTQALNDICSLLSSYAQFKSKEQINLNLRIASQVKDKQMEWFYDLTNNNWEFVKIICGDWYPIKNEIIFRRFNNQQPQVYPLKEYEPDVFDRFMKLVNIRADDEEIKLLLQVYIIILFVPNIQKPVLMLHGSQGSAKSSLQEMIKMLVDPGVVKTFAFPRGIDELIQQLAHNQVVFYDNISIIKDYISDQLCRAVSGSGSSKRQLYTDDDDIIHKFKRCVGFNGINLGATKPDLLDRGLIIELERIDENNQLKPEALWKQFEDLRPQLLGYIFDILAKVLEWKNNVNGPQLNLTRLPRMAEFAEYGEMISRCMGNPGNLFINAYYKNIKLQSQEVLDLSVLASPILQLLTNRNDEEWIGTPTGLLSDLEYCAEQLKINTNSKSWPKMANVLSRRLKEIRINLKQIGIEIEYDHDGKQRVMKIRKIPLISLMPLEDENHAQNQPQNTNDTNNTPNDLNDVSLANYNLNCAQMEATNDTNDTNDTLHNIQER
jgi:hypothetical protein